MSIDGGVSILAEILLYYLDSTNSEYSNESLSKFLAVAANEVFFDTGITNYTVNITDASISPDPTTDQSLSALLVLKAAVVAVRAEIKKQALVAGYRVTDDKATIDGKAALDALRDLLKEYQKNYDKAMQNYQLGDGQVGLAILSPYTPGC